MKHIVHHRRPWLIPGAVFVAVSTIILLCASGPTIYGEDNDGGRLVKRGKYLVSITGCDNCHTPHQGGPEGFEPDPGLRLSGHPGAVDIPDPEYLASPWGWMGAETNTAFADPWGISFAANLTPDESTGLGNWTEEMFMESMKSGLHIGTNRLIMPPMPWRSYAAMTEEDLIAVFAYLKTLPPIENLVPDYEPSSEKEEQDLPEEDAEDRG